MFARGSARGSIALLLIPLTVANAVPWICCLCSKTANVDTCKQTSTDCCGMACCSAGGQCCCRRVVSSSTADEKHSQGIIRCFCERQRNDPVVGIFNAPEAIAWELPNSFDVVVQNPPATAILNSAIHRRTLDTGPPPDLVLVFRHLLF